MCVQTVFLFQSQPPPEKLKSLFSVKPRERTATCFSPCDGAEVGEGREFKHLTSPTQSDVSVSGASEEHDEPTSLFTATVVLAFN